MVNYKPLVVERQLSLGVNKLVAGGSDSNYFINLFNPSSINNHYLPTYLTPSVIIGTSVHYCVSFNILTPTRVQLPSHLLFSAWISFKAHLIFIVSLNALLIPHVMLFVTIEYVKWSNRHRKWFQWSQKESGKEGLDLVDRAHSNQKCYDLPV